MEHSKQRKTEKLLARKDTLLGKTKISAGTRTLQSELKPRVVWLILKGNPEEALALLAENYKVATPKLRVGLPKGRTVTAHGCYTPRNETISVLDSDTLHNPFVILHEFYHHLRTSVDLQHRGTEKNADKFALDFIIAYKSATSFGN